MDTRKRLYKTTTHAPTLSERVKRDRTRQNETRKNKFNANRNIEIDLNDSAKTPTKLVSIKLSQIKDKTERLKAYIEQKRTNKLKKELEQRSPFIPYVPVGRWVEKKEVATKKSKAFTISTPVRKALMSDGKILKKTTIKEIATTARKENVRKLVDAKPKESSKSRKKILTEFNNVPNNNAIESAKKEGLDLINLLDETFELIASDDESKNTKNEQNLTAQKTLPINDPNQHEYVLTTGENSLQENLPKNATIPENSKKKKPTRNKRDVISKLKNALKNESEMKQKDKVLVPVKRPNREIKPVMKSVNVKKANSVSEKSKEPSWALNEPEVKTRQEPDVVIPSNHLHSKTYKFYKASLEIQQKYISIKIKSLMNDMDCFIEKLPEETQSTIHRTIQQANLLTNEKFKNFEDILEKYENVDELDPKRITEDDLENYWILLCDQIEEIKKDLQYSHEAKTFAMKEEKKRRRTRRTLSETPSRRSRRIAETGTTPKHNSSICLACTPMSTSKVNTPKSAKKKRETLKKSLAFDMAGDN